VTELKRLRAANEYLKATVTAMVDAVRNAEIAPECLADAFVFYKRDPVTGESKVFAVPPDRVEPIFAALVAKWKSAPFYRWVHELLEAQRVANFYKLQNKVMNDELTAARVALLLAGFKREPVLPAQRCDKCGRYF
jgi:hypothetical protein